jgi:rod shape-determining protein MreD
MIMPAGHPLLLPVKPWFIGLSVLLALLLQMSLGMVVASMPYLHGDWLPDVLAVVLLFWVVHEPQHVGIGTAFLLGLMLDVHHASWLGEHALVYSALAFQGFQLHRRLPWFHIPSQALHVLPLLFIAHALQSLLQLLKGVGWPNWETALAPLLEAALWPLADWLLLSPQRQPHDPDESRPL